MFYAGGGGEEEEEEKKDNEWIQMALNFSQSARKEEAEVISFCLLYSWSTRPTTVPVCSDHYFHTECPSVLLSVPELQNQAKITAGQVDCVLAEWIILPDVYYFQLPPWHIELRIK